MRVIMLVLCPDTMPDHVDWYDTQAVAARAVLQLRPFAPSDQTRRGTACAIHGADQTVVPALRDLRCTAVLTQTSVPAP